MLGPKLCHQALPSSSHLNLYDAIVCGAKLAPSPDKQLFVDTGLIHLMVVSGSHLLFLEMLLSFLPRPLQLTLLGIYSYFSGWQPPVVRGLLRRLLPRDTWGSTPLQNEAASVLMALALYPPWLISRAFLMSWMGALALHSPPLIRGRRRLDLALKCYLFLLPFCWNSPYCVAWNALLSPLIGLVLFPACLVVLVVHPLVTFTDRLWEGLLYILRSGPQGSEWPIFVSALVLCWLPWLIHGLLLGLEVRWRRAQAFFF